MTHRLPILLLIESPTQPSMSHHWTNNFDLISLFSQSIFDRLPYQCFTSQRPTVSQGATSSVCRHRRRFPLLFVRIDSTVDNHRWYQFLLVYKMAYSQVLLVKFSLVCIVRWSVLMYFYSDSWFDCLLHRFSLREERPVILMYYFELVIHRQP